MTVDVYPGSTDPFAAILAVGDSWFWHPISNILALTQLDLNYKNHRIQRISHLLFELLVGDAPNCFSATAEIATPSIQNNLLRSLSKFFDDSTGSLQ